METVQGQLAHLPSEATIVAAGSTVVDVNFKTHFCSQEGPHFLHRHLCRMKDRGWRWSILLYLSVFLSVFTLGLTDDSQQPLDGTTFSNETLLWGPYRPNLYFGVRPRIPKSLLTGLLWANVESFATVQNNFRHTCEQHEGMAGYGWDEYDARNGGRQVIHDTGNKIDLTIDFVKVTGDWAARVKGTPRKDAGPNVVTTVLFYAGMEGLGELGFNGLSDRKGMVSLNGQTNELGKFQIDVTAGPNNRLPHKTHKSWDKKPLDRTLITSAQVPPEAIWQGKNVIYADMKPIIDGYIQEYGQDDMPPPWAAFTISDDPKPGNFHVVQKIFVDAFEFDIIYSSGTETWLNSDAVDRAIPETSKTFNTKFQQIFKPAKPFTKPDYTTFSESLFSNLLGGVGYFYGDSLVDRSYAEEYFEENEGFWEETAEARAAAQVVTDPATELFTSVPSRPFFPRGFLWDEGFHLVPIVEWDIDLTMEIVLSWFKLIDSEGWIAREQILGPEARSKVPGEFQVQYPHYANPPTLFMIVETLIEKVKSGKLSAEQTARIKSQLETLYPLLKRQYNWFRRTQFGDIKSYDHEAFSTKEAYRWRGRTPQHILTSGLDDYPRPQPPHPGELHVDLISWVGMMQRTLTNLSTFLGESDDTSDFQSQHMALLRNLDDLHWSTKHSAYCDATIDDYEESTHVCHKGYISLFPFMTGLLPPDHASLPHILKLISSPTELWSDFGIRSLSAADEFYGTDENYWRSPIWVNMNYLILKNLLSLATSSGPKAVTEQARKIYVDLRKNLCENVYQQWKETGFAWEQYNPETGKGQRTQHFTGWTSLVTVIMRMPDLSGGVKHLEL
jgi:mannosyl-oligosaccharide glucosidase